MPAPANEQQSAARKAIIFIVAAFAFVAIGIIADEVFGFNVIQAAINLASRSPIRIGPTFGILLILFLIRRLVRYLMNRDRSEQ